MRRRLAVALWLSITPLPRLTAQWSVAADIGVACFGGASVDTAANPRSFRPHGPTLVGLQVDRRFGRAAIGLGLRYAPGGLALENSDVAVVRKGTMSLYGLAPEFSWRVAETDSGARFTIHAGPVVELWTVNGEDARTRAGAQAALSLQWPITSRLAGSLRAGVVVTGSPFQEGELPSEFERRALWRRSIGFGLHYRL